MGENWSIDNTLLFSEESRKILHSVIDKYYLEPSLYGNQMSKAISMLNNGTLKPLTPHLAIVNDNHHKKDYILYDSYVKQILGTMNKNAQYDTLIKLFQLGFSWIWSSKYTKQISPLMLQQIGPILNKYYIHSNKYEGSITNAINELNSEKIQPLVPGMAIIYSKRLDSYYFAYIKAVNDLIEERTKTPEEYMRELFAIYKQSYMI